MPRLFSPELREDFRKLIGNDLAKDLAAYNRDRESPQQPTHRTASTENSPSSVT